MSEIYTKNQLKNSFTNKKTKLPLFDLVIVPRELAKIIEVELDDNFVLAKADNVIETEHRFGNFYLLRKLEEQRPDIMCAMDSAFIDDIRVSSMVYERDNPPKLNVFENDNYCYCEPCTD